MTASIAACTPPAGTPPACATGSGFPMQVVTLYFGMAIPGRGELTETEWLSFLDTTITANLPNGYTVFDASGGWMNPMTRKTIKENTKVLIVALPQSPANGPPANGLPAQGLPAQGLPDSLTPVNRIRTAYQLQFHQQLVGMTVEHACGTF